jgi:hypothetical protein
MPAGGQPFAAAPPGDQLPTVLGPEAEPPAAPAAPFASRPLAGPLPGGQPAFAPTLTPPPSAVQRAEAIRQRDDRASRLPLVQRLPARAAPPAAPAPTPAPNGRAEAEPAQTEEAPATQAQPARPVDLEKLARDVLPHLKRLMLVERERRPRS